MLVSNVRADVEEKVGVTGYGDVERLTGVVIAKNWTTGMKLLLALLCSLCACTMTPKVSELGTTIPLQNVTSEHTVNSQQIRIETFQ